MCKTDNTGLVGRVVCDTQGRTYRVVDHYLEADELVLARGSQERAITLMEIADGPFELLE